MTMMQLKTTLDSGKIIYEAYSYSEAENPTAKVDIYAVDKNAAITLTGLTVSQTYTLGAGKGGQLYCKRRFEGWRQLLLD